MCFVDTRILEVVAVFMEGARNRFEGHSQRVRRDLRSVWGYSHRV